MTLKKFQKTYFPNSHHVHQRVADLAQSFSTEVSTKILRLQRGQRELSETELASDQRLLQQPQQTQRR